MEKPKRRNWFGKSRGQDSSARPEEAPFEEKYGLFELEPEGPECCVDIIAVHGLQGHYKETWASDLVRSSGKPCIWLKDLLPSDIPNARILSFGYNSAVAFSKSVSGISEFAEQLLSSTHLERLSKKQKRRPIIFVCHSLGGIVFKKAIMTAHNRRDKQPEYMDLLDSIKGVLFMGTPHQGSEIASLGSVCADVLEAVSLGRNTNSPLIKELKESSNTLQDISHAFAHLGADLSVHSFFETEKMDFLGNVVVTQKSARLNIPNEHPYHLNGNHSTICKFPGKTQDYKTVSKVLKQLVSDSRDRISEYLSALDILAVDPKRLGYNVVRDGVAWFFESPEFNHWVEKFSEILWLSGKPGDGKTTLAFCIWDQLRQDRTYNTQRDIAFSICGLLQGGDTGLCQIARILSTLIVQLTRGSSKRRELVTGQHRLLQSLSPPSSSSVSEPQIDDLWRLLSALIMALPSHQLIIIIDAVDEIRGEAARQKFLKNLLQLHKQVLAEGRGIDFKILVTSRSYDDITKELKALPSIERDTERQACLQSLKLDTLYIHRDLVEDDSDLREDDRNLVERGSDLVKRGHPGTGKWLADDPAYRRWNESRDSSLLLIRGKPGSGKSTLAKQILKMKESECKTSQIDPFAAYMPVKVTVAHFFYTFRGGKEGKSHTLMLQSLLFQLLSEDANLFPLFQSIYRARRTKPNFKWQPQDLKDIFVSLSSRSSTTGGKVYIMLDAMDESIDKGRPEILKYLQTLCSSKSNRVFKCLVASRPLPAGEMDEKSWNTITMEEKTRKDIQIVIQSGLRELRTDSGLSTFDFQFAQRYMAEKAEGVFLWVALVIQELKELALTGPSEEELKACLERLPIDLGKLYKTIIQRLVEKGKRGLPDMIEKGAKMLTWVTFAERPLKVEEFEDAIAVPSSPRSFHPNAGFLKHTRVSNLDARIKACCGPLLEIRKPVIQLLHLTFREYLLREDRAADPFDTDEKRGDAEISSCCIRYLRILGSHPHPKAITSWGEQDYDELVEWLTGYPLLNYVLQYLPVHLQALDDHSKLADRSNLASDLSLFMESMQKSDVLRLLLGHWLRAFSKSGDTDSKSGLVEFRFKLRCLLVAASKGLVQVVISMIHLSADVNGTHKEIGATPLIASSSQGHLDVVQILIAAGVNVDAQRAQDGNALLAASLSGHLDIVRLLLHAGAYVNAQGGNYGNALQAASLSGHLDIVRLLLDAGADVNSQGGYHGTALQAASLSGHLDIVRLLLDAGADVSAQGGYHGTSLQAASIKRHSDVVRLLFERGAVPQ